ncbi:AlkA N-terminal domain-containing protein [Actinophytocola sp.]|uniref:AlkA N-terminal domain-containing protein n=1 Tax=Actinophytocola sp. TaxID=1872138 RepID=UPI002D80149C|nr:AlkA N-terminal domain-containing protein [Actinophytocola sp.]HET9137754.1 AlkA N-terminal domain-containing protein [Actinophytocola sp.]
MYQQVDRCLKAVLSKDDRFDGWFFSAVLTTGVYCRPSCPVPSPKPQNMRFYPTSAAAQAAGFRACKRCRPDASPGSPEWNERADLAARLMRLIADGVVDRDGVAGLAARVGYSVRQVERQLYAELGAGPLALARAQRAQSARILIETTLLPMGQVAYGAGFSSVRTFNETVRHVFGLTPSELRTRAKKVGKSATPSVLSLRLPFRRPLSPDNLFEQLAATAVPGVEEWRDGEYRCALRLPHGHGIAALRPHPDHIMCELRLTDLRDLSAGISRCRWLLDLDADPVAVDELLGADDALAPLVTKHPGRRVPRTTGPAEFAVRAVLGQRASTTTARELAARLVAEYGKPIEDPLGGLTHLFPEPADLAGLDPDALGLTGTRTAALTGLIDALVNGGLDLNIGADWEQARAHLTSLRRIDRWTVETIAMRALGDPDAFVAADPAVRAGAGALELPTNPAALVERSARWRPWRAYAGQYLRSTNGVSR